MKGLIQASRVFLKRNGSTILTCMGGVGVVATTVTAVKATPKALKAIEHAENKKGEKLTTVETLQVAGPAYIPAVITGTATIACIFGANVLNKRQQAALMSAYALLDNSYKDYKKKVNELYGAEADSRVREEIAKDNYESNPYPMEDDKVLFYDEYSKEYFESTMEKVLRAEYLLNRNLSYHSYALLNEFYDLLGLPQTQFGDILGWSACAIQEYQWYAWVEFNHRKVELEDGLECYILEIVTEPEPNFEDY